MNLALVRCVNYRSHTVISLTDVLNSPPHFYSPSDCFAWAFNAFKCSSFWSNLCALKFWAKVAIGDKTHLVHLPYFELFHFALFNGFHKTIIRRLSKRTTVLTFVNSCAQANKNEPRQTDPIKRTPAAAAATTTTTRQ